MEAQAKSDFLPHEEHAPAKTFVLWRPAAPTGLMGWLTTVDHKKIGFLYGFFALIFFLIGGGEGLLIRTQLMFPHNTLPPAQPYNTMFTPPPPPTTFLSLIPPP